MGVAAEDLAIIAGLKEAGHLPARGRVMELGAQQINTARQFPPELQTRLADAFRDGDAGQGPDLSIAEDDGESRRRLPLTRELWRWLGYDYAAIDLDGSPGALPLDLNFDSVPDDQRGRFDLVTNLGTTEHVANQLNAFKAIHDLTARRGVMFHNVPAQGYSNHGLVNYNMKFFWMLARSNAYELIDARWTAWSPLEFLNQDVAECMAGFDSNFAMGERHKQSDTTLTVVLRKLVDIPFVPPLDLPSGTEEPNAETRERYWTVFDPERLDELIRKQAAEGSG